jgi:hypothetical protein
MKTQEITTTNFTDFGYREREILLELLSTWHRDGLPEDFNDSGVHPMMNKDSGHVFLTNEDYQVAMLNDYKLESFYTCFNCGYEGFAEDCQLNEDGCNECNPQNHKAYNESTE